MILLIFSTKIDLHALNFIHDVTFQTHFFKTCVTVGEVITFVYQRIKRFVVSTNVIPLPENIVEIMVTVLTIQFHKKHFVCKYNIHCLNNNRI